MTDGCITVIEEVLPPFRANVYFCCRLRRRCCFETVIT